MSSSQPTSGSQVQDPSSPTPSTGSSPSSSLSFSSSAPISSTNYNSPSSAAPTTDVTPTSTPPPTTTTHTTTTPTTPTTQAQTTSTTPTTDTTTTTPTTAVSSTMTTVMSSIPTTIFSTDPAGSTVFLTTDIVTAIPTLTPATSTSSTSTNTHTAAIIGGAVGGGVAGIALLVLFIWCIRRKVRRDEFDGNFDPDRVAMGGTSGGGGTLPRVDLADEVTPFPHPYTDREEANTSGSMRQRQYGEPAYVPVPSSMGHAGSSEMYYPPGASSQEGVMGPGYARPGVAPPPGAYKVPMNSNINMYGTASGPSDWHTPVPMASPPPSTVTSATSSGRATKEREAMGRQGMGLGLATQSEGGEVVVHQDAGRAPSDEHRPPPREIPPTYDSIRQD